MQTPQTNQTIKQFTPKTKFLNFVKTGLLQYNTTNKGSRPEIQDDPGERGREKREDVLQHHQQGNLLHVDDELPSRYISAERWQRLRTRPTGVKRKNNSEIQIKRIVFP